METLDYFRLHCSGFWSDLNKHICKYVRYIGHRICWQHRLIFFSLKSEKTWQIFLELWGFFLFVKFQWLWIISINPKHRLFTWMSPQPLSSNFVKTSVQKLSGDL